MLAKINFFEKISLNIFGLHVKGKEYVGMMPVLHGSPMSLQDRVASFLGQQHKQELRKGWDSNVT